VAHSAERTDAIPNHCANQVADADQLLRITGKLDRPDVVQVIQILYGTENRRHGQRK
jgi:hypothetical protein